MVHGGKLLITIQLIAMFVAFRIVFYLNLRFETATDLFYLHDPLLKI